MPSVSLMAVVRSPCKSEPAPGSVIAIAAIVEPSHMPGIHRSFWASVP